MTPLYLGTRGSRLALWQANYIADQLRPLAQPRLVELTVISTSGDQVSEAPLAQIGGEGVFTKEIQMALLDGRVDIAVHSLKDLPTQQVDGLTLAAVPPRGSTNDVLVSQRYRRLADLPNNATVATSSLRRRAQVLHHRPDLHLVNIRGNVESRLRKLVEQSLDALILAQAGLERLGLDSVIVEILDPEWMLPAVGQGALGLECRAQDVATRQLLGQLDHRPTRQAVLAERSFLRALGGGCQVPIGAASKIQGQQLNLRGVVLRPDGSQRLVGEIGGATDDAEILGRELAEELLSKGALKILSC